MTSRKLNRFHSAPPGPHQKVPSVSTPSTSSATALIAGMFIVLHFPTRRSFWMIGFSLSKTRFTPSPIAVSTQADVADQAADAVGLQRSGLVGAPHGAVEGDVPLDHAGPQHDRRHRWSGCPSRGPSSRPGRRSALEGRDRPQVQLVVMPTDRCWWCASGPGRACRAPRRRGRSARSCSCRWRG